MSLSPEEYQYNVEKQKFDVMRERYIANGEVSWSTFLTDKEAHQKSTVYLWQLRTRGGYGREFV